jgi:hypothetical protein
VVSDASLERCAHAKNTQRRSLDAELDLKRSAVRHSASHASLRVAPDVIEQQNFSFSLSNAETFSG